MRRKRRRKDRMREGGESGKRMQKEGQKQKRTGDRGQRIRRETWWREGRAGMLKYRGQRS